jgi:uncharacterized alkaline shock family protein YloU
VAALVGASGTGKSFRARLVAERDGADLIVDDGLLIQGDAILTGHWAKKERTVLAATRRALFDVPGQAREAREALRAARFRRVLIVGTSRRMVERIAERLDLPRPSKVYTIEDVASRHERETARAGRRHAGAHAAPLPLVSVRRGFFASLAARIGEGLRRPAVRREKDERAVRSIAAPGRATAKGVTISEPAVRQMVRHCVAEHDPRLAVRQVRIRTQAGMHRLEVGIRVPFGTATSGDLHRLREYILHSLERHAGILLSDVRIVVQAVGS